MVVRARNAYDVYCLQAARVEAGRDSAAGRVFRGLRATGRPGRFRRPAELLPAWNWRRGSGTGGDGCCLETSIPKCAAEARRELKESSAMKPNGNGSGILPWIKDEVRPQLRTWEQFYRNRWQHDKIIRSTHGVNCTGGCTWQIYVKDGIVTWEMQGLDYPTLEAGLPPYEPRGCQRGISYSWYLYSPLRVRYPYMRGALLDLWKVARSKHEDPVEAWRSLVENPEARTRWQRARGKGGFRRADWDCAVELIAAANIHTIKRYGPDRIAGFSPIPAMSMVSYASGARMLQLMGGIALSFYDWYCDLPPASPETWGEQTDVAESADWYNSKLLAVMGSNLNMTRTPDCHFAAEARHNGSKMWVFAPDFNQVAKYADEWISINAGQDGAWWMAVNHVLLKEFHHDQPEPHFIDYTKRYTDAPFLVELQEQDGKWRPGQLLR